MVYAENKAFVPYPATHGIRDEEFVRDRVPMTKEEVRTVSLAKLGLLSDSVCWDVGAGTGSVSVEMALRAAREGFTPLRKNPWLWNCFRKIK